MTVGTPEYLRQYIEQHIGDFHNRRLASLDKLKLDQLLKRKNPYLFRAKNVLTAQDLVKSLLDAHLSSQEEALFGNFLEGLAIEVCRNVYGGSKSAAEGVDLEFDRDGIRYLVAVKSGPNWGNSSQIKRMVSNFKTATRILRTSNSRINIRCVNGCCYGQDAHPDKGDYVKLCGQDFWELVSGNAQFYTTIVEPLGHQAKQRNDEFAAQYAQLINRFTQAFSVRFCPDGVIDWPALVAFNSQSKG